MGKIAALRDLEQLLAAPRDRLMFEAPWERTLRVVQLELAWAYARVGSFARSAALVSSAVGAFDERDGVEREVLSRYLARIEQVSGNPWRPAVAEPLHRDDRYVVDHLMSASLVLAPGAAPNAQDLFRMRTDEFWRPPTVRRRVSRSDSPEDLCEELRALDVKRLQLLTGAFPIFRAAIPRGLEAVRRLASIFRERWPSLTDGFSSNQYWCLNVIVYVDAVAFAIAEAADPPDTGAR